jgi:hypothetical protein
LLQHQVSAAPAALRSSGSNCIARCHVRSSPAQSPEPGLWPAARPAALPQLVMVIAPHIPASLHPCCPAIFGPCFALAPPAHPKTWNRPRVPLRRRPRSLMYSFAQRSDTVVLDEPLYASYLRLTGLPRPYREQARGHATGGEGSGWWTRWHVVQLRWSQQAARPQHNGQQLPLHVCREP